MASTLPTSGHVRRLIRPNETESEIPTMSTNRILGIGLILGSLVADLRSLKVGQSTLADIQKLPDAHPRFFVKQTSTCNGHVCYFGFGYPISLLGKLGLASRISL